MTDDRTNEDLATRMRQLAESQAMDFDSPHVAMTLNEVADRLERPVSFPAGFGDGVSWLQELHEKLESVPGLPEPRSVKPKAATFHGKETIVGLQAAYFPSTVDEFAALARFGDGHLRIYEDGLHRLTVEVSDGVMIDAFGSRRAITYALMKWAIGAGIPITDEREPDEDYRLEGEQDG